MAHVSVMVYYTSAFKTYIADPNRDTKYTRNHWPDPVHHIKRQVAYTNLVFHENKLPVKMELHLIEELKGFDENSDGIKRWEEFVSAKKSKAALLMSADVAILMTGSTSASGERGMGGCCSHNPFAWVFPEDELTFIHELGHIFGCSHNTESWSDPGTRGKSNCGTLVKGSNMLTIMSYLTFIHNQRIPYFSSKDLKYQGFRLGDDEHDNRGHIMKARFLLSVRGDKRHIPEGLRKKEVCKEKPQEHGSAVELYTVWYGDFGRWKIWVEEVIFYLRLLVIFFEFLFLFIPLFIVCLFLLITCLDHSLRI